MDSTLQIRIDKKTKEKARRAFFSAGLDMSSGVKMYLARVASTGKVPFDVFTFDNISTDKKREIVKETEHSLSRGRRYDNPDELIDDILGKK